ncbi:MAG: hypothetical protein WCX82_03425 [archaeon]|jgi:hypothetical protein
MTQIFKKKEEIKNKEESIVSPHHSKKKLFVWQIITGVLLVALIITILLAVSKPETNKSPMTGNVILASTVDQKVVTETINFLKETFSLPDIEVKGTVIEDGLYKTTISLEGKDMPIYYTLSGDNLIIPGMGLLNKKEALAQKAEAEKPAEVQKSDKPKVEVFIMSHCPYGTQMEKGLIPVIETLNDKADIEIKFVDYAMHGKTELDEELNQYCINKEEPEKFLSYLKCFLEEGKTSDCLTRAEINATKVNACVAATDSEYKVTELFNDKSTWQGGQFPQFNIYKEENELYGVQGSPTTVINGVKVENMPRNSAGILNQICLAFNDQPEECQTELSSDAPSAGFGYEGTGTNSTASCS